MRGFIFLLLLLFAHNSQAQSQTLRVVALEGLPLHAAPSGDSDVLALVPYGAQVVGEADVHEREVLDGLTGFWVAVFHEGKSGFAFSAHLLPAIRPIAEWELKGSKECIVLPRSRPHEAFEPELRPNTFQANFYRGDYFWYGMQVSDSAVVIDPIEVVVSHYSYTAERVGDMPDDYRETAFFYEAIGPNVYDQLLVSKQMMPEVVRASNPTKTSLVQHPYPDPSHGVSVVFESEDRTYSLESALSPDGNELEVVLLIDATPVDTLYHGYSQTFLHVMWSGDFNGDGFLDFLIKEESLADCCGCHAYFRYAYSRNSDAGLYYDFSNDFW
ncbi:SH3 domain-containing protein [Flavobacteriales bacterium]|nr:SH3 domain-containing protein [Flavobacteriales bacterium]